MDHWFRQEVAEVAERGPPVPHCEEPKGSMSAANWFARDTGYSAVMELRYALPTLTFAMNWCTPGGCKRAHAKAAMHGGERSAEGPGFVDVKVVIAGSNVGAVGAELLQQGDIVRLQPGH